MRIAKSYEGGPGVRVRVDKKERWQHMAKCDCCKEQFQQVDADKLCFSCSLVQDFARGIEEKTELAGDHAINLACEFVELVKARILERGRDAPKETWAGFFEDVSCGMSRVATNH